MSSEPATTMAPASEPPVAAEEKKPVVAGAPSDTKPADSAPEKAAVEESKPVEETKATPEATKPGPVETPLSKLLAELPSITKEASHNEIWGVTLGDASHVPTTIVLEKFLRANNRDVSKAKEQLISALKWRKEMNPTKLLAEVEFDQGKFGGLGFVTVYPKTETHAKEIVTWNIYGAVKDKQKTFGDVREFIRWRSALMELSVQHLDLASATTPIPADGVDQYRMVQVHDYLNVSFLRMDPAVKAASKETIQTFSMAYPELLKEKFFVNVPLLMGWVFGAMKLFLSPETVKKFHPLSYGSSLAGECKGWGEELPEAYGGKGKDVKEGLTVKYGAAAVEEVPAAAPEEKTAEETPAVKE